MKEDFRLGEIVYLKTDGDQLKRIVTCLKISGGSQHDRIITYELSQGDTSSEHYSSEITKEVNELEKLGIDG